MILPEIICILMDFGLAVFWSTFILMHSFGEKFFFFFFFLKKKVSHVQFNAVLVQMVTNRSTRLKNTWITDISFESHFLRFFQKNAFYEKFENHEKHQLKFNVYAFIYLSLVGHNLQGWRYLLRHHFLCTHTIWRILEIELLWLADN